MVLRHHPASDTEQGLSSKEFNIAVGVFDFVTYSIHSYDYYK